MFTILLQILVILLCLSWVLVGVILFISGYRTYYKIEPLVKVLGWDNHVHVDYISKRFFGETEGNGLRQMWMGFCSIAAGSLFFLFLIFGGYLFG